MEPLVENEERDCNDRNQRKQADRLRMEPVETIPLLQQCGEGAKAENDQQQPAPVELGETLITRIVYGHARPDKGGSQRGEWNGLIEHKMPIQNIAPERSDRVAQAGKECSGERVAGES